MVSISEDKAMTKPITYDGIFECVASRPIVFVLAVPFICIVIP